MESAALVLTAAISAVVVLQLITIALVLSLKKKGKVVSDTRTDFQKNNQRNDNRGKNNSRRNNNRPHDNRPRNNQSRQSTASVVDPVEKSLRDINLKLKNAERDQENTRKKMQKHSRDGRNQNKRNRRDDNRLSKNNEGNKSNHQYRSDEVQNRESDELKKVADTELLNQKQPVENSASQASVPVISDLGVSEENLQHGRKFAVKRRVLASEEANGTQEEQPAAGENLNPAVVDSAQDGVKDSTDFQETGIRFGRR